MFRIATFILAPLLLLCADTSWTRVKDLKGHAELRIYKTGARESLNAMFYDANDDRIVVVVKNRQMAIPKADIDRIDTRPVGPPPKTSVVTTEKQTEPDYIPRPNAGPPMPGESTQSNISFGSKPDFETIYRRGDESPKK